MLCDRQDLPRYTWKSELVPFQAEVESTEKFTKMENSVVNVQNPRD